MLSNDHKVFESTEIVEYITWKTQNSGCIFTIMTNRRCIFNCCVWPIDMTDWTGFMNQQAFLCNPHTAFSAPCALQTNSTRLHTTHTHTQNSTLPHSFYTLQLNSLVQTHTHQGFTYIKQTHEVKHMLLGEVCINPWIVMWPEYYGLNN